MSKIEKLLEMLPENEGKMTILDKNSGIEVQVYKVYDWLWRIELKSINREDLLSIKKIYERRKV